MKKFICMMLALVMCFSIVPVQAKTVAPTLEVTNIASTGKPYLKWRKIPGAKKYIIYYTTSGKTDVKTLYTTKGDHLTHSSAITGKTYVYEVCADMGNGESVASDMVKRTCDLPRPTMKVAGGNQCPPYISWTHVDGAIGYEVWSNHAGEGYKRIYRTKTGSHVTHRSAIVNSSYRYRVRAIHQNNSANSAYTPSKFVDTTMCTNAPGCPVLKANCDIGSGKPVLTWNHTPGAKSYEIFRMSSSNKFQLIGNTPECIYTDNYATPGKNHKYYVRTVMDDEKLEGNSNFVNIVCKFRRPSFKLEGGNDCAPYLSWYYHEGEDGMQVWCSKDGEGYKLLCTAKHGSLKHSSAEIGHTYKYRIRAVGGLNSANSAYSYTKSVTVK